MTLRCIYNACLTINVDADCSLTSPAINFAIFRSFVERNYVSTKLYNRTEYLVHDVERSAYKRSKPFGISYTN